MNEEEKANLDAFTIQLESMLGRELTDEELSALREFLGITETV